MEKQFLTEENGFYQIDCTNAVWATDAIHQEYHNAGLHIHDVDFLIENDDTIYLIEYKNADIPGAASPNSFQPESDKKVENVVRKYFDSLHYLTLLQKRKRKHFVYILEYPNGDSTSRKRLRNHLKTELPFALQRNLSDTVTLIDDIDVLSIEEWNTHQQLREYPISNVTGS
jgi:hypothetical protein